MHHVDKGGVTAQVDGNDADVAPSLKRIREALVTGHSAAIRCVIGVHKNFFLSLKFCAK